MLLSSHDLIGLPVLTRSGTRIGRVSGFEFEAESQTILRYLVRQNPWFGTTLPVHRSQVVSITATQMTVEDGTVAERGARMVAVAKPATESQPAPLSSSNES